MMSVAVFEFEAVRTQFGFASASEGVCLRGRRVMPWLVHIARSAPDKRCGWCAGSSPQWWCAGFFVPKL